MPSQLSHPSRAIVLLFLLLIAAGTLLLRLPMAQADGQVAPWMTAWFTAVSAVCVTGLVVVDTGTYWTPFGQVVVLLLFQLGGFGLMTAASLLGLMVNRSLRLRTRLMTQTETHALGLGDVTGVARVVLVVTVVCELVLALVLASRFRATYDLPWDEAAWSGLFHAVSAFNNAGFSLYGDSLTRFAGDAWVLMPVMLGVFIGGIGFPVLQDMRGRWRTPRRWSLHTKLTLGASAALLLLGALALLVFEWSNPRTLGALDVPTRVLNALFASVAARTAGFNTIDIGALAHESLALHYLLMFIGGGSAGTAGGVKVTTAAILLLLVVAEVRGRPDSEAFGRRVSVGAQRQAITVLVLGSCMVVLGSLVILRVTDLPTDRVIFEVISAFATVGLSTGITADLPPLGQGMLTLLMFVGRVGTITVATSLALGERRMSWRLPEEHPIVG